MSQHPEVGPQLLEVTEGGARSMQLLTGTIGSLNDEAAMDAIMQMISQDDRMGEIPPQLWTVRTDYHHTIL